jgi:hypothetical protein
VCVSGHSKTRDGITGRPLAPGTTISSPDSLARARRALERKRALEDDRPAGIVSRGRFRAWLYEVSNQDHSFMQGVEWLNSVPLDVPETTVRFAETANAMWGKTGRRRP